MVSQNLIKEFPLRKNPLQKLEELEKQSDTENNSYNKEHGPHSINMIHILLKILLPDRPPE